MFCIWIGGFLSWKIYKSTRNCQWIERFFGFGWYWENLQFYKESRYTYSQFLLTASMRGQNIYSVLQMDRWIFHYIWKIYKSTRNCQWIGGFFGFDVIGKIYKSTRNCAIYIISSQKPLLLEVRKATVFCKWIGGFLNIFEKSTNLQGIANG